MVDDDAVMRHLVKTWLHGHAHCQAVSDASEAMMALQARAWDVIFVDLNLGSQLPEGDGLNLVEAVHSLQPQASCVLITAHGKQEEFSSAVNLGVDQILIKPFLKATFFGTLQKLQDIRQTRQALKEARSVLEQQNEELQRLRLHEQKLASLAQKYLLFTLPLEDIPGLQIHGAAQAQEGASGDLLDAIATPRGLSVVSGDVMGKGLGAAIVSAGIKNSLAQLRPLQTQAEPALVLASLRDKIEPMLRESDSLLTLTIADIDTHKGLLEIVDCGAPHVLLQRACDGHILFIAGNMMPLGICNEPITSHKLPLLENDRLLLVSDGILDAWGLPYSHEAYGQVAALLALNQPGSEKNLVDHLIHQECTETGIADDRSCMAVRYTARTPELRTVHIQEFQAHLDSLRNIRDWAQQTIRHDLSKAAHGDLEFWVHHMTLGLSEMASNVIVHACHGRHSLTCIRLLMIVDPEGLWLEWHYQGEPFVPSERESRWMPTPGLMAQSGYGMPIIDEVFDHVHYFTSIPHSQSILAFKTWPR